MAAIFVRKPSNNVTSKHSFENYMEWPEMSRKRSSYEISADILKVALRGAKKSHIVYQANLNFSIVKGYL